MFWYFEPKGRTQTERTVREPPVGPVNPPDQYDSMPSPTTGSDKRINYEGV